MVYDHIKNEPCVTSGLNGTCVGVFRCPTASLTYLYANAGYIKSPDTIYDYPDLPEICSYKNKEPVVCCTDCNISKDEPFRHTSIGPLGIPRDNNGPIAWSKCLDYLKDLPYPCRGVGNFQVKKIWKADKKCHVYQLQNALAVGGRDAQRWEFPHMALLGYGDDENSAQWLCGGTVISERFILTAAHCISTKALGNVSYAALGLLKRTDPKELWNIHKIKRIIPHPEYSAPSKYHDIALLETETEKSLADTLQVVVLQKFDDATCANHFPPHRHLKHGYDSEKQSCYGNNGDIIDTCEGDSGGPLQTNQFKCQYTVVGVTSYGKNCGIPGSAGMYTRVSYYVPWIESIVWPEETEERMKQDNLWLDKWLNITT
ncbi:hypothetical protein HF086_003334 [Spodoptera exigua]|uniref:Uncharacterized protein n=1 Tax=Spodoptera exigua TaxID=7107 RepID=A0A922SQI5_SPOEX|nr:hypothetical protein HF086_003334 [Spodoptera exigua]